MQDEDRNGKVVEFPTEEIDIPTNSIPQNLGRVDDEHPLRKEILVLLIILCIFIVVVLVYSFAKSASDPAGREIGYSSYREEGSITYTGSSIDGWFLDADHQHFMADDGKRYTYVDPHTRRGRQVAGYWRLMQ